MKSLLVALSLLASSIAASPLDAQLRETHWSAVPVPPLAQSDESVQTSRSRPLLRTAAALIGSAAAFAYTDDQYDGDTTKDRWMPVAAGVGGGALGAMLFTNANPIVVVLGSALAALPGAALSHYLSETIEDGDENHVPVIAFSVPHGLLTSAFAQHRR